ncbi:MAG: hypothetical protein Q9216_006061, partial [Gyalolechia sp. 2 TL-2023]
RFGEEFCPQYLATASNAATQTRSSDPSALSTASTAVGPPTATSKSYLGAGMGGTNWQSIPGKTPDHNRGPTIQAVCITLLVLAAGVVAFRIYARLRTKKLRQVTQGLSWDELFACIALLLLVGIVACISAGVRFGMGKHQDHQTASDLVSVIKIIYAFTLIITLAFCALKLSILCLYLRMTPEKTHRIAIFAVMGFVIAYTIAVFLANTFLCTPISGFWDLESIFANQMGCVDIITMDIITNSWSAFEDLVIWALPIPVLWKLKVPTTKKAGLYTLIGISFISVICAFVRVGAFVIWIHSSEISWNFPLYPLLCTIETCVALITSSLPAIYALFRKPAPEHRRSAVIPDNEKAWDSQGGSTLKSVAGDRRSRWSFLAWHGFAAKKMDDNVEKVAEEGSAGVEDEERSDTTRSMTAYVSSVEEAKSSPEKASSHRRKISSETESLCYVGKGRSQLQRTVKAALDRPSPSFYAQRNFRACISTANTMTLPQTTQPDSGTTDQPSADQTTYDGKLYSKVSEGVAQILYPVSTDADKTAGAKQSVFYNPIQQFNRDLSVLAIRAFAEDLNTIRRARHERRLQRLARGGQKGKKRKREASRPAESSPADGPNRAERPDISIPQTEQDNTTPVAQPIEEPPPASEPLNKDRDGSTVDLSPLDNAPAGNPTRPTNGQLGEQQNNQDSSKHEQGHPEPRLSQPSNGSSDDVTPPFRILDALSATGLRALRYAKEIPHVTSVTANDISAPATASIKLNVEYNGLVEKVHPTTGDAKALMGHVANPGKEPFHVVDLDPYGTAAPFLDTAVQAVTDGGLLCVTCTDAAIFASVGWPEKTFSLYGGLPWRGPQGHEAGLRLVLNAVATSAARYGLAIEPLVSLNIDFYVRLFIRVKRSPVEVKCLAGKTMVVYNCDQGCGAFHIQYLAHTREREAKNGDKLHNHTLAQGPTATPFCDHCGFKTHLAGPMWGGPLHNPHFLIRVLDLLPSLDSEVYGTLPRIEGMLTLALNETLFQDKDMPKMASGESAAAEPFVPLDPALRDPHPFFINPSTLSRTLHCTRPSDASFRGALIRLGYRATRSHTEPGSIRTDAPWHVIWEIMREWVRQKHPIKEGAITKGMAGWEIMQKDRSKRLLSDAKQELRNVLERAENTENLRESVEAALYRISRGSTEATNGLVEDDTAGKGSVTCEQRELQVVFDEKLGKEALGKKIVRYQQNPRAEWGPMSKAKAGH